MLHSFGQSVASFIVDAPYAPEGAWQQLHFSIGGCIVILELQ
jgi:hypothetical protein